MERELEKITKILEGINEEIPMYQGSDMFEADLLDSFSLIDLVARLEEEFSIYIEPEDVIRENFANKEQILNLITRYVSS